MIFDFSCSRLCFFTWVENVDSLFCTTLLEKCESLIAILWKISSSSLCWRHPPSVYLCLGDSFCHRIIARELLPADFGTVSISTASGLFFKSNRFFCILFRLFRTSENLTLLSHSTLVLFLVLFSMKFGVRTGGCCLPNVHLRDTSICLLLSFICKASKFCWY